MIREENEFDDNIITPPPQVALLEQPLVENPFVLLFEPIVLHHPTAPAALQPVEVPEFRGAFTAVRQLDLVEERKDKFTRPIPLLYSLGKSSLLVTKLRDQSKHLLIFGPPGTGKTSTVYTWNQILANSQPDVARVWISLKLGCISVFYKGYVYTCDISESGLSSFNPQSVKTCILNNNKKRWADKEAAVLIIDGVTSKNYRLMNFQALRRNTFGRIIVICSEQSPPDSFTGYDPVGITGWTLEEYITLCNNNEFFNSVVLVLGGVPNHQYTEQEKERLLKYKYFYAGHSPRYMFEYTVQQVKDEIAQLLLQTIQNFQAFIQLQFGTSSSAAVNRLVSKLAVGQMAFVSEYVVRSLERLCHRNDICMLHDNEFVSRNPCMDGWALEADFIFSVRNNILSTESRVRNVNFPAEPTTAGHQNDTYIQTAVFDFYRNVPPAGVLQVQNIVANTWWIPEVFNQGGFDCVQILAGRDGSPFVLRFVQVTRQEGHILKVHYMRIFLNAVNAVLEANHHALITLIEIVIAYPRNLLHRVPNPANPAEWRIQGEQRTGPPTINYGVIVFDRMTRM